MNLRFFKLMFVKNIISGNRASKESRDKLQINCK